MNAAESTKQDVSVDPADTGSELEVPRWSVISFDRVEAHSRTYLDAFAKMETLEVAGVAGLCVVTDEVAARITERSPLKNDLAETLV